MGSDVQTIGKHQLNFTDLRALAHQLSDSFGVNINAGYRNSYPTEINKTNESKCHNEFILLEQFTHKGAEKTLHLIDEHYQLHELYNLHGEALFNTPLAKGNSWFQKQVLEQKNDYYYILSDIENEQWWVTFLNDIATALYYTFDQRWWLFCAIFTTDNWDKDYSHLNEYRKGQHELFKRVGCNKVYHCNDQGETINIIDCLNHWHEIEHEVNTKLKNKMLNISAYMNNPTPRTLCDFPAIFYDDFNDLK